jgi:2-polyprenyl-3-methyl-5-hydroxy-6-metoxy-1,4-benzoquinol methylase
MARPPKACEHKTVLPWFGRLAEGRVIACAVERDSTIVVRDGARFRELVEIGEHEMVHTRVLAGESLRSGFAYTDAMHAAAWLAGISSAGSRRALCLGAGGGIIARQLETTGARVDVVDASATILELAREHFDLRQSPALAIHHADAGDFVASARAELYDVVLVDLFEAFEASPLLARREFFEHMKRCLRPNGAVAVNSVGSLDGSAGAMLVTHQAMAAAFGNLLCLPMLDKDEKKTGSAALFSLRNVVAFASRDRLPATLPTTPAPNILPELPFALARMNERLTALDAAACEAAAGRAMRLRPARPSQGRVG